MCESLVVHVAGKKPTPQPMDMLFDCRGCNPGEQCLGRLNRRLHPWRNPTPGAETSGYAGETPPANPTYSIEVSAVTRNGIWLLLGDEELFLPFDDFPWFRSAPATAIFQVERPLAHHLYWPELDVDLDVASIRRPTDFLLVAQAR
jgi:hypothetical protein